MYDVEIEEDHDGALSQTSTAVRTDQRLHLPQLSRKEPPSSEPSPPAKCNVTLPSPLSPIGSRPPATPRSTHTVRSAATPRSTNAVSAAVATSGPIDMTQPPLSRRTPRPLAAAAAAAAAERRAAVEGFAALVVPDEGRRQQFVSAMGRRLGTAGAATPRSARGGCGTPRIAAVRPGDPQRELPGETLGRAGMVPGFSLAHLPQRKPYPPEGLWPGWPGLKRQVRIRAERSLKHVDSGPARIFSAI